MSNARQIIINMSKHVFLILDIKVVTNLAPNNRCYTPQQVNYESPKHF